MKDVNFSAPSTLKSAKSGTGKAAARRNEVADEKENPSAGPLLQSLDSLLDGKLQESTVKGPARVSKKKKRRCTRIFSIA